MKTTYTFTVLRYIHDIVAGEFVNVGLALYAPEARYVSAICTPRYGRLNKMFLDVNGDHFRSLMRFIQARFDEHAQKIKNELPLDGMPKNVLEIAQAILPPDDSSLQWSEPGGGLTENPSKTLEELYLRMVQRYEEKPLLPSRSDEEIWHEFRKQLEAKHVLVQDSEEKFRIYMLLGEPRSEKLKPAFGKAMNILKKMPGETELIPEHRTQEFSKELADEVTNHAGLDPQS